MADYIVSARKYRPDSFGDLIGQDNIVQTLKNSIVKGKLAHAYLFCGPRGVGKTTAARIFAKIINCSEPSAEMEPCGHCESCVSFAEGRSFCIHELDAASNNGVDDIKNLMEQVQIPPQIGRYSVYIIDEVHMLSQSAFNAFLKTLEEPPAHAIFILATTEKHKILPTILSRCQTFDFNRISIPDIVRNLRYVADKEGVEVDDASLHIIARKADGAMRDALTIFDQTVAFCGNEIKYEQVIKNLDVLDYEVCFAMMEDFLGADYRSALLKFDEILSKGFNALHFVSALSSHIRDLIVCRSGGMDSLLDLPDSVKRKYYEQSAKCSPAFLYEALNYTTMCEAGYAQSVNQRLHVEFALMKICYASGAFRELPAPSGAASTAQSGPTVLSASGAASTAQSGAPVSAAVSASSSVREPVSSPVPAEPVKPELPESKAIASEKIAGAVENKAGASGQIAGASENKTVMPEAKTGTSEIEPASPEKKSAEPEAGKTYTEAPSAKPRRRASKTGASLSISALIASSEEKPSEEYTEVLEDKLPSDEEIIEKWTALPDEYKNKPRLSTALASAKTEIKVSGDTKILTFSVLNEASKAWIEEHLLRDIETRMMSALSTRRIRLEVSVLPDKEMVKKAYLPDEMKNELVSKNPEVARLMNDLGLDVK